MVIKVSESSTDTDRFIELVNRKHPGEFTFEETEFIAKIQPLFVNCKKHGRIKIVPKYAIDYKHVCSKCSIEASRSQYLMKHMSDILRVHGDKYDYSKVVYINASTPVEIICPKHGSFMQCLDSHVRKANICPTCSTEKLSTFKSNFLERARIQHGDKYDYSKVDLDNLLSDDRILIICPIHGEWEQRADSHVTGYGCRKCFLIRNRKTTTDFVSSARLKHGDSYDYSKVNYTGNKSRVEIICPKHGSFMQIPQTHLMGNGCVRCRESLGERTTAMYLDDLGFSYKREFKFDGHLFRYDFCLPKWNVLIEFHGKQHYEPVKRFGGESNYLDTVRRDKEKVKLAEEKGYRLIVLTYRHLSSGSLLRVLKKKLTKCIKI